MRSLRFACMLTIFISTIVLAQKNPVPLINQPLVPASAKPGSGGFSLTVNGTGFSSGAILNWNGSSRVTEVISSSQLKATISALDVAKAGTASVTVVNPSPGGGTSSAVYFPIRKPLSSVALAVDPNLTDSGAVTIGDFNNDGKLDVAVGETNSNGGGTIAVYLGKGDGTFESPVKTNTAALPYTIVAADFNGDGNLDLAVGDSGLTHIFLGHGDGTMTEQQPATGLVEAVGDWNGDGNLDLVLKETNDQSTWSDVYLGNGDGTFNLSQQGVNVYGFNAAVGDFNGDGKLDLAFPGVDVLLGNGDGTFRTPVRHKATYDGSVVAADVNGDGFLDLVTSGVSVLLGNGKGGFKDAGGVDLGQQALGMITSGDFNGDGKLDLAVQIVSAPKQYVQNVSVLLGTGAGKFQPPIEFSAGLYPGNPTGFAAGDFNSDGKLDLITAASGTTFLFLQTVASVSPTSLSFGNQDVGTKSKPQTVTLKNIGSIALKIKGITITGADSKDFVQANNCGRSLPPGGSCKIQVTFMPKTAGSLAASVQVSYQGVGSPQLVSLSGTGVPAATVSLTPAKLAFPVQLVGTKSSAQTATLTNTGSVTVTISKISATAPFSEINNCPSRLPASGSCQIQVSFKPTAKGPASGKLSVADDATGSPQTVALSGAGTVVKLSPIGVNFGDQKVGTKSAPVPVQLTNAGTTTLSISQIAITGADAGDFSQTNNCGSSVPPGGNCTIQVTFQPTATGQRSANLAVSDDGGGSPQEVPLSGTGT